MLSSCFYLTYDSNAFWNIVNLCRVIYDPDFDDNASKTLASLELTDGKFLEVIDDDDRKIVVYLKHV